MCVTHQHMCTHKTAFPVGRQSAFTYTSDSRGSESPVCSAARGPPPPLCTTGSQQPNSRQPTPATAVVQTLRETSAFALHSDHTHRAETPCHAVQSEERQDICLGPNLDEDTKQR